MIKLLGLAFVTATLALSSGCATCGSSCGTSKAKKDTAASAPAAAAAADSFDGQSAYNAEKQTLTVSFPDGDTYEYAGVPQSVADEYLAAKSKGKAFNTLIKGKFEGTRIAK